MKRLFGTGCPYVPQNLNHSCKPVVQYIEVVNDRRTTVVVATIQDIRRGQEVTVGYGNDLWFLCRCQLP